MPHPGRRAHDGEEAIQLGVVKPGIAFLHKPFTSETPARTIRDLLDR